MDYVISSCLLSAMSSGKYNLERASRSEGSTKYFLYVWGGLKFLPGSILLLLIEKVCLCGLHYFCRPVRQSPPPLAPPRVQVEQLPRGNLLPRPLQPNPPIQAASPPSSASVPAGLPSFNQPPEFFAPFSCAPKFYDKPLEDALPPFTPLTDREVAELLKMCPALPKIGNRADGSVPADSWITTMHREGIVDRIYNRQENENFKRQIQFILYTISKMPTRKQKLDNLMKLGRAFEYTCSATGRGVVELIVQEYLSTGAFEKQVSLFMYSIKDQILEDVINQLKPELTLPGYHVGKDAREQFPHIKHGCMQVYGPALGLTTEGAMSDPKANQELALDNPKFLELFREKVSIQAIVRAFIIEINGRNNLILKNEDFLKWAMKQRRDIQEDMFYDPQKRYPSYSPVLTAEEQEESTGFAYITEEMAVLTLQQLGYIELA